MLPFLAASKRSLSLGSISSSDVAWTRQSSTPFMQSTPLTTLSEALHQAGPELLHPIPAVVKCMYLVPSVVGNATAIIFIVDSLLRIWLYELVASQTKKRLDSGLTPLHRSSGVGK